MKTINGQIVCMYVKIFATENSQIKVYIIQLIWSGTKILLIEYLTRRIAFKKMHTQSDCTVLSIDFLSRKPVRLFYHVIAT